MTDSKAKNWLADLAALRDAPNPYSNALADLLKALPPEQPNPYSNALTDLLKALPSEPKPPSAAEILALLAGETSSSTQARSTEMGLKYNRNALLPGALSSAGARNYRNALLPGALSSAEARNYRNALLPGALSAAEARNAVGALGAGPAPPKNALGALASAAPRNALLKDIPIGALGLAFGQTVGTRSLLDGLLDDHRSRSSWNDRFAHWEKPASVTEEGTIERAQENVQRATAGNRWLGDQGVSICRQGSYHHNTNVRQEADIDLRAEHPALKLEYGPLVVPQYANNFYGIGAHALTFNEIFGRLRRELIRDLRGTFGASNVDDTSTKAIKIKGITGSRAKVDVVPAICYRRIHWDTLARTFYALNGVALLGTDGRWTINYPDLHERNGIQKRSRTANRFKRIVRIFKRLRADMDDRGLKVFVPSFLLECLVYVVEDEFFLVEADDRYDRVRRIAKRMQHLLSDQAIASTLTEINGVKPLFGADQAWTHAGALRFVTAVVAHLGDC